MQEFKDSIMTDTPPPPRKRKSPMGGCVSAVFSVALIAGVMIVLIPYVKKYSQPTERAGAQSQAQPQVQVFATSLPPTITQTPTQNWEGTKQAADAMAAEMQASARELENRIKSDEATSIAAITQTAANDARTATVVAYATAQPATQTAVHGAAIAVAQRNASEAEKLKNERKIEYVKGLVFEIGIPAFIITLIGILVFAFFAAVGKKSLADEKTPEPAPEDEYDENFPMAPEISRQTVIEVSSPASNTIIRSKASETIMEILPLFAEYAIDLASRDDNANPLTDEEWAGEDKHGVTKPDWYRFRNWLIQNGFARWKNDRAHKLGAELTDSRGWPLMKKVVEGEAPSPTELGI